MISVALMLPASLALAQTKPPESVAAEDRKASPERVFAPKDKLQIDIAGRGGFSGAAEVQEDGLIFLPYGSVRAAGRTPSELAAQIAKIMKNGEVVTEPVVTVELIPLEGL
jgi:protein involved in polysaccharide export with SLBB domain